LIGATPARRRSCGGSIDRVPAVRRSRFAASPGRRRARSARDRHRPARPDCCGWHGRYRLPSSESSACTRARWHSMARITRRWVAVRRRLRPATIISMTCRRRATNSPRACAWVLAIARAGGREMRDCRGVEPVGLGQFAGGANIADLAWVDHRQRQLRCGKGAGHHSLEPPVASSTTSAGAKARKRSTNRAKPSPSRPTAKLSPEGRRCTPSRSFATSMPTKCSMSRPCACGLALAWRWGQPRRLFGLEEPTNRAPCSGAGFSARGASGLPSATAAPTLTRRRDDREIQGAGALRARHAASVSPRSTFSPIPLLLAQQLQHAVELVEGGVVHGQAAAAAFR